MSKLTIKEAKAKLDEFGISLSKRDGEFRVYPKGNADLVYHTDDIEDALNTGYAIAAQPKKAEFNRLMTLANVEWERGFQEPCLTLAAAQQNADDTFKHDENAPRYWDIALDSIQCSIEANNLTETLFPWFRNNGHRILVSPKTKMWAITRLPQ